MASPVGAIGQAAAKGVPLIVKHWPKILMAVGALTKFVNDHPDLPDRFRKQLSALPDRIADAQRRRGDAAKIRGTLDIVRDVARDAQEAEHAFESATWIRRADDIALGVRLAEELDRPQRKPALAKLKAQTDTLLADLIDTVAHLHSGPFEAA